MNKLGMSRRNGLELVREEIRILKSLNHENIVKLIEVVETETSIDLVFPYVGEVINGKVVVVDAGERTSWISQLREAVQYLHRNDIIHCDIKPSNVLLMNGTITLIDFGSAIRLPHGNDLLMKPPSKTTPAFHPPEVCLWSTVDSRREIYGKAIDVWCFGLTVYWIIYGELPFPVDGNIFQVYDSIINWEIQFKQADESFENEVFELLKSCLRKDPTERHL